VREIRERLDAIKKGDKGRPMREALAEFAAEVGVKLD